MSDKQADITLSTSVTLQEQFEVEKAKILQRMPLIEAAEENVRLLKGLKEIEAHEKLIADLNDQVNCAKDQMDINKAASERIRWEIDIKKKDLVAAMG